MRRGGRTRATSWRVRRPGRPTRTGSIHRAGPGENGSLAGTDEDVPPPSRISCRRRREPPRARREAPGIVPARRGGRARPVSHSTTQVSYSALSRRFHSKRMSRFRSPHPSASVGDQVGETPGIPVLSSPGSAGDGGLKGLRCPVLRRRRERRAGKRDPRADGRDSEDELPG